jgi:hypothetical protein
MSVTVKAAGIIIDAYLAVIFIFGYILDDSKHTHITWKLFIVVCYYMCTQFVEMMLVGLFE